MYYNDVDIQTILTTLRSGKTSLQYINAESNFMWDQLTKKMSREFEIKTIDEVASLFGGNTGLFKPAVYIIPWVAGIQEEINKFASKYNLSARVIIRLKDEHDDNDDELRLSWLRNHDREQMINAFLKWLQARDAVAERGAINVLLDNYHADEIKIRLDYVALRDDNVVTEAAILLEMGQEEENIFKLQESLIYGRKDQMLEQYNRMCERNPPLKIVASLTTQTRRILQAVQAIQGKASAEQLAEVAQMSPGYARRCMDTARNSFFKPVNSVLLFSALIGIKHQIITSPESASDVLRIGLLKYITSTGYAGT
ncbi:hypothetical protein [Ewingella americana]|uniref:DNA polymerase III delta subunit-like C-terminal domain-containing protein n=1 Tax=Ewingella americana TaxID=41202 RepID=A0A502GDC2_9GAMM|nr:hypothetical protein [Ewingella americana]TPG60099.1 hypothetical protein EAH77_16150 [Ewingella americana]